LSADWLATLPIWYVVFLFSTVCHEAAHALVAKWGGDMTAYAGGQVTLDPMPHIRREPFGLVFVPILMMATTGMMFGWGSAPINPIWQIRYPKRAAIMALAGPLTNFLLVAIAGVLIHIGLVAGVFQIGLFQSGIFNVVEGFGGGLWDGLATFVSILFVLNVILGAFNLLPIPPLDGYSVLGLFLSEEMSLKMQEVARQPLFSMIGILVAWKIAPIIIYPALRLAVKLLFPTLLM